MMSSMNPALPLNAILMRQDEETNESIAKVVDCAVARFMQATWASSLILHGSIISVTETYCPILHGNHLPCNIMDYTNKTVYSSSTFVFDATQYPCPPTGSSSFASATPSSPFSGSGLSNLKSDIQKAAINNGFVLFSNGGEKENRKRFCCNHNVVYRGNQLLGSSCHGGKHEHTSGRSTVVYRKSTLTNDRRNSRGPARLKLPKRTTTARPLKKVDKCSFSLTICTDGSNFFSMKGGIGSSLHCGHPQLYPEQLLMSSCLLKSAEKEDIRCIAAAHASPAVARNNGSMLLNTLCYLQISRGDRLPTFRVCLVSSRIISVERMQVRKVHLIRCLNTCKGFQVQAIAACITMPVPTRFLNPSILLL